MSSDTMSMKKMRTNIKKGSSGEFNSYIHNFNEMQEHGAKRGKRNKVTGLSKAAHQSMKEKKNEMGQFVVDDHHEHSPLISVNRMEYTQMTGAPNSYRPDGVRKSHELLAKRS